MDKTPSGLDPRPCRWDVISLGLKAANANHPSNGTSVHDTCPSEIMSLTTALIATGLSSVSPVQWCSINDC